MSGQRQRILERSRDISGGIKDGALCPGYPEHAAREVALPLFILLNPENHPDELDEELAEKERAYQKYMAEPNEEPLPTTPPTANHPESSKAPIDQFATPLMDWDGIREDNLLKAMAEVVAERRANKAKAKTD